MSQKELLYVEDGINHERMVTAYLYNAKDNLEDKNIQSFIEKQIRTHEKLERNLLKVLEVCSNEW